MSNLALESPGIPCYIEQSFFATSVLFVAFGPFIRSLL